jgi:N-acetylglucosaminyldiphosphoundecaprenol N-acetyl-beta-D-mannosaminyltransferase
VDGAEGFGVRSTDFIGVRVDALTYEEMFVLVDRWLSDKESRSHHIGCINAYCTTLALEDARLAAIYGRADIAGPDGMPFVHWIRWVHRLPCDRFYAPDLVLQFAARARQRDYTFFLYGGSPETASGMRRFLQGKYPYLQVVGHHSPPFRPLTTDEDKAVCEEINALKPDILCVGLGTPKQDYWIEDHLLKIRGSIMIACGATFDFFGGRIKMAPRWVQRSGFEWLYRLASKDFARLWRRYTLYNARFLWHFAQQLAGVRKRPAAASQQPPVDRPGDK